MAGSAVAWLGDALTVGVRADGRSSELQSLAVRASYSGESLDPKYGQVRIVLTGVCVTNSRARLSGFLSCVLFVFPLFSPWLCACRTLERAWTPSTARYAACKRQGCRISEGRVFVWQDAILLKRALSMCLQRSCWSRLFLPVLQAPRRCPRRMRQSTPPLCLTSWTMGCTGVMCKSMGVRFR